jgi:hypothetical protein
LAVGLAPNLTACHPIFRLEPLPGGAKDGAPTVSVTLGEDDPVTFASSLPDEFAHVYFSMLRHGVSSGDAFQWLERIRRNAWRHRFTVAESRDYRPGGSAHR